MLVFNKSYDFLFLIQQRWIRGIVNQEEDRFRLCLVWIVLPELPSHCDGRRESTVNLVVLSSASCTRCSLRGHTVYPPSALKQKLSVKICRILICISRWTPDTPGRHSLPGSGPVPPSGRRRLSARPGCCWLPAWRPEEGRTWQDSLHTACTWPGSTYINTWAHGAYRVWRVLDAYQV